MAVGKSSLLPYETVIQTTSTTLVPANALTTILTFTNTGDVLWLDGFEFNADVDGEYSFFIDTVLKFRKKMPAQNLKPIKFGSEGLLINVGSIIDLKVEHFEVAFIGNFDATIFGHRS